MSIHSYRYFYFLLLFSKTFDGKNTLDVHKKLSSTRFEIDICWVIVFERRYFWTNFTLQIREFGIEFWELRIRISKGWKNLRYSKSLTIWGRGREEFEESQHFQGNEKKTKVIRLLCLHASHTFNRKRFFLSSLTFYVIARTLNTF